MSQAPAAPDEYDHDNDNDKDKDNDNDNVSVSALLDHTSTHGPYLEADESSSEDSQSVISTQSLRESLVALVEENGRTYNKFGVYLLPVDESEKERLWIQYEALHALFGKRDYFAPLTKPRLIKDVGTGPGYWCYKIAQQFPNAQVVGTDISVTSFLHINEKTPPNLQWLHEDALEEWGSERYDYIHTGHLLGSFEDFREVIAKSFANLEPGGWMESVEMWSKPLCDDETMGPDNAFWTFSLDLDEAAMRAGRPLRIANKLKRWYQQAGFVDVVEERFKIPINGWPKDPKWKLLGKCWGKSLHDGLQAFAMKLFTSQFGWTRDQVEVYLSGVRSALADKKVHAYHDIYVVYGRKPTLKEHQQSRLASLGSHSTSSRAPTLRGDTSSPSSTARNGSTSTSADTQQPRPNFPDPNDRSANATPNRRPQQTFSAHPHGNVQDPPSRPL